MAETDSASNREAAEYLAAQLEHLMALPLTTPEDLERWDKECAEVQSELVERFPSFQLEHFALHFFDDSDIRLKDPGCRQAQHQVISRYIARLRHEET